MRTLMVRRISLQARASRLAGSAFSRSSPISSARKAASVRSCAMEVSNRTPGVTVMAVSSCTGGMYIYTGPHERASPEHKTASVDRPLLSIYRHRRARLGLDGIRDVHFLRFAPPADVALEHFLAVIVEVAALLGTERIHVARQLQPPLIQHSRIQIARYQQLAGIGE